MSKYLEKFAPYTKLYNEKDCTYLYENHLERETFFADGKWNVTYEKWMELVEKYDLEEDNAPDRYSDRYRLFE